LPNIKLPTFVVARNSGKRTLDVGLVAVLVHGHLGELEGVDDVVDLGNTVLNTLLSLLGGSVGTSVYLRKGSQHLKAAS
jgi:hypothetical protein